MNSLTLRKERNFKTTLQENTPEKIHSNSCLKNSWHQATFANRRSGTNPFWQMRRSSKRIGSKRRKASMWVEAAVFQLNPSRAGTKAESRLCPTCQSREGRNRSGFNLTGSHNETAGLIKTSLESPFKKRNSHMRQHFNALLRRLHGQSNRVEFELQEALVLEERKEIQTCRKGKLARFTPMH